MGGTNKVQQHPCNRQLNADITLQLLWEDWKIPKGNKLRDCFCKSNLVQCGSSSKF